MALKVIALPFDAIRLILDRAMSHRPQARLCDAARCSSRRARRKLEEAKGGAEVSEASVGCLRAGVKRTSGVFRVTV